MFHKLDQREYIFLIYLVILFWYNIIVYCKNVPKYITNSSRRDDIKHIWIVSFEVVWKKI